MEELQTALSGLLEPRLVVRTYDYGAVRSDLLRRAGPGGAESQPAAAQPPQVAIAHPQASGATPAHAVERALSE